MSNDAKTNLWNATVSSQAGRIRLSILAAVIALLLAGGGWYWHERQNGNAEAGSSASSSSSRGAGGLGRNARRNVVPVQIAVVRNDDIHVFYNSLGTVTAGSSVVVHPRVDGLLAKLMFKEGDVVRAGQQIALIDPRSFQVQLAQAEGQVAKDTAQLANARNDLARYKQLLAEDSISRQQVDTQQALVQQYEGTLKSDQAQADNARLQLSYTRVLAPVSGRLGLRQVDEGNLVKSTDANGLVSINQVQPINVTFTLAEAQLPVVLKARHQGKPLSVEAWDREQKHVIAKGQVASMDNQIDTTTGTVKIKASFANKDESLFPNQFVNVKLLAETHADAIVAPAAAVQRGRDGAFVYIVQPDNSVTQRKVKLGAVDGLDQEFLDGLKPGDAVVVDGIDQLREGARVEIADASKLLKERPRGKRGRAPAGEASTPSAEGAPKRARSSASSLPPAGSGAASAGRSRPDFSQMSDEQRAAFRAEMQRRREAAGESGAAAAPGAQGARPDFSQMTDEQRAAFRAEMRRRREAAGKQDSTPQPAN